MIFIAGLNSSGEGSVLRVINSVLRLEDVREVGVGLYFHTFL